MDTKLSETKGNHKKPKDNLGKYRELHGEPLGAPGGSLGKKTANLLETLRRPAQA